MPKPKMHPLSAKIKSEMDIKGITNEEIAIAMRKDVRTYANRKKKPEYYSVKELQAITKKLKITVTIKDGEIIV